MAAGKKPVKPNKQALGQEIATVQRSLVTPVYGGILPNTDETLRTRGGGKGLAIYDEVERDAHAFAVLNKRKLAVIRREWEVRPASDAAADVRLADLVRGQIAALGFDQASHGLLDAILKGFAVGEVLWEADGNELVAAAVKPRDQRRFVFDPEGRPRLLTSVQPSLGEELPERKFIVHSTGAKDGSPYGRGLGSILFWPVFFKRKGITFWLTFADKFGSPTAVGKYPAGTETAQRDLLLEALKAIAQESEIVIPDGMQVEFLEAARTGSIDTYEKLARYMDEQISEAVLGETLTTNIGDVGSKAASETHNDVREEIAKADADLLSATLNRTLVRWIAELNDPAAAQPTVWRLFEEEEDLSARADRDTKLWQMGLEPEDETYWERTYGEKWKKRAVQPPVMPAFAEPDQADTAAQFADRAGAAAMQVMDGLIAPIRELVMSAKSLEEVRDGLLALYPNMAEGELGDLMQRVLTAAELAGRAEVKDGV
jgi:phage gp29-like protein